MDLQIQELRNSIMEEVILKNYKLLQFVENEIKLLKDDNIILKKENAHLREKIKLLKDDNIYLKENKNLFSNDIQNIQDTIDNTMIIGYDNAYKQSVSWNIDKALQIPSFKKFSDLRQFFSVINCRIILSSKVFKHINKFNNFTHFYYKLDNCFVDEKFNEIYIKHPTGFDGAQEIGREYNNNGTIYIKIYGGKSNENWFHKQNLKKLLDILTLYVI